MKNIKKDINKTKQDKSYKVEDEISFNTFKNHENKTPGKKVKHYIPEKKVEHYKPKLVEKKVKHYIPEKKVEHYKPKPIKKNNLKSHKKYDANYQEKLGIKKQMEFELTHVRNISSGENIMSYIFNSIPDEGLQYLNMQKVNKLKHHLITGQQLMDMLNTNRSAFSTYASQALEAYSGYQYFYLTNRMDKLVPNLFSVQDILNEIFDIQPDIVTDGY